MSGANTSEMISFVEALELLSQRMQPDEAKQRLEDAFKSGEIGEIIAFNRALGNTITVNWMTGEVRMPGRKSLVCPKFSRDQIETLALATDIKETSSTIVPKIESIEYSMRRDGLITLLIESAKTLNNDELSVAVKAFRKMWDKRLK